MSRFPPIPEEDWEQPDHGEPWMISAYHPLSLRPVLCSSNVSHCHTSSESEDPSPIILRFSRQDDLEAVIQALPKELGNLPPDLGHMLVSGLEIFTLSEACLIHSSLFDDIWDHCLATGFLAARITLYQGREPGVAWQAFVGGVLHDMGMLIFLAQHPQVFPNVLELARCRNDEITIMEKYLLGATHGETGAQFLTRWGIDEEVARIVAYHHEPFQVPQTEFTALTAVFAANILEGGGLPQDGDGVIDWKGEAYLTHLGLWNALPEWQRLKAGVPYFST